MSPAWTVSLPRFQGPLDLLLALVCKHEVPITEIPLAEITRQYLDYLHAANELDVDLGADFTDMAATLILIKSKSLLPQQVEAEEADSRQELIRELLDYQQVRQAAEFLERKIGENAVAFPQPLGEELADSPSESSQSKQADTPNSISLLDVLRLAQRALELARTHRVLAIGPETVTVEEMLRWLEVKIAQLADQAFPAESWFQEQETLARKITLFLALLEVSRTGRIQLQQNSPFEPLSLCRPNTS